MGSDLHFPEMQICPGMCCIIIWKGLMSFWFLSISYIITKLQDVYWVSGEKSERNHWVFCQCPERDLESNSWVSGYCPEKPLGFWLLPGETTLSFDYCLSREKPLGFWWLSYPGYYMIVTDGFALWPYQGLFV